MVLPLLLPLVPPPAPTPAIVVTTITPFLAFSYSNQRITDPRGRKFEVLVAEQDVLTQAHEWVLSLDGVKNATTTLPIYSLRDTVAALLNLSGLDATQKAHLAR